MIAQLTIGALLTGGGLRIEIPDDAAPVVFGLESNTRFFLLEQTFISLSGSWAGGVNDTNPNRKLIAQRAEIMAGLGYQIGGAEIAGQVELRVGAIYVDRWPRGKLSRLAQLSGIAGVEFAAVFKLGTGYLEPYVGYDVTRLNQIQVGIPSIGCRYTVPISYFDE